jgi:hypothetical protein
MSPVALNIKSTPQEGSWGYTYGPTVSEMTGNIQPGAMHLDPNLLGFVGTKPTSPRNEQKIDASSIGLGWQTPARLNEFAADVVGHEYGHNVLDMPGFEKIKAEVMGTNINKLFANPKSVEYLPSVYDRGIYKAGAKEDMSDFDKEEIFNRLLDLERGYRRKGDYSGILASKNPAYIKSMLRQFANKKSRKSKWGSKEADYINLMEPIAKKYFTEVDRQGRMGPINKAKLQIGMPENLSFDTGASNIPITSPREPKPILRKPYVTPPRGGGADVMPVAPPKKKYVAPLGPRGDGGQRGSMPTGTAGRNPWGRADGGLINLYKYGGFIG